MLISIVLTTFNRPHALENALASIALQAGARFEVIVVNDGGVDVSAVVARWAQRAAARYLPQGVNAGLAAARNAGLREARGDVLCFLDDDDVMLPGHLRAGLEALTESRADAAYTRIAVCDAFIEPGREPQPGQVRAHYRAAFDARLLLVCNFLPVNAVFLRRRADAAILFDETLPQLEDWDLWLRLHARLGYRFHAVPRTTAIYHRVPGGDSMTARSHELAAEARRFRETFRRMVRRYPSSDPLVREGRALHDAFYEALAQSERASEAGRAFEYERFVECMEAFVSGRIDTARAWRHIRALGGALAMPSALDR